MLLGNMHHMLIDFMGAERCAPWPISRIKKLFPSGSCVEKSY
jgi:hypothetical protein